MSTQRKLKWALVGGAVLLAVANVVFALMRGAVMRWVSVVLWLGIAATTFWDLRRTRGNP